MGTLNSFKNQQKKEVRNVERRAEIDARIQERVKREKEEMEERKVKEDNERKEKELEERGRIDAETVRPPSP